MPWGKAASAKSSRSPKVWGHPPTHAVFRTHAIALGQLALAWNELHESMALLFCTIMGGGYSNQFLAVWHVLKADRAQRDILVVAAKEINGHTIAINKKLADDVKWLCGQADRLEDTRNDALHSPLFGSGRKRAERTVTPITGLGHIRAQKLADTKNVLKHFEWCRDSAMALTEYCRDLDRAFAERKNTWPDRPKLPNRGDTSEKKPLHPIRKAARPRPPPPSQA